MSGSLTRRIVGVLAVLGVRATSPVAGQDPDITVTFATGAEPNGDPWHWVEATVWTFDIHAPKTLEVRASFRTRTVADRAAGRAGRVVFCRYRSGEAVPEMGGWWRLHWLGCDEEWPEPRTFERLGATDGKGGERRGGVSVTISKDGRTYEMRCEDVSEAGKGRRFACWLP